MRTSVLATRWVERQERSLLPIECHHVVFTIPDVPHPLLRANPCLGYNLLADSLPSTLAM